MATSPARNISSDEMKAISGHQSRSRSEGDDETMGGRCHPASLSRIKSGPGQLIDGARDGPPALERELSH